MDENRKTQIKEEVLSRIDMSQDISDEDIARIIDECIIEMSLDEYVPLNMKLELRRDVFNSIRRLDVLSDLLEDDTITEIMINGPDDIYIERDGWIYKSDKCFESADRLHAVIQQIVSRANRMVNESSPIVDLVMDSCRINVVLKGVSVDGSAVTIRKFPNDILDMRRLIEKEAIDEKTAGFVGLLVAAGYNIFISGGTGAGKTTFLNALTEYIPSTERVITIEDSAELNTIGIDNQIRLEARNANVAGENPITIRDLIRTSLRMRPDRIIVGEVRGSESIDMLQAMNTGHDGSLSTGHANSAHEMLFRLETMVLTGVDLPLSAVRSQIATAIDIVIHLGRLRDGSRKVLEIREVTGMNNGEITTSLLYKFEENDEDSAEVKGDLVKQNDLKNVEKLMRAGLIRVYRENYA